MTVIERRPANLYEVEDQYAESFERVMESYANGVPAEETDLVIFEQSLAAAEEKRDAVAGFMRFVRSGIAFHMEEEKRLYSRRRAMENALERLNLRVIEILDLMGVNKVSGKKSTISVQDNSVASMTIEEGAVIPKEFYYTPLPEPVLDTHLLREAIEAGREVPGVSIERGRHLRVR